MSINPRELKQGSYYLVQSNDKGVLALRELPESEYKVANDASYWLHSYHYHKRREKEVMLNLDNFFERYSYYETNGLKQNYKEKHEFFVLAYVDLNRVLTNFLSSFRLFVDNLESFFKKSHGPLSDEYLSFKRTVQHEFNSKFAYRLMYSLRNYSQHKGFPIKSVGMDNNVDRYTREVTSVFTVNFDKDQLLSDDPGNFRHLKHDFALYNRLFPVLPQVTKIRESLALISNAITNTEKTRMIEMSNKLLKYYKFLEGDGELGFAHLKSFGGGKGLFDSKEIPINILREIYRDIEGKEPPY